MSFLVAPSILSADFANLQSEVVAVEKAGADWIHVDVMDGHFVPNLTIGPPVVKSLKRITRLPLDVHLMIEKPDRYFEAFVQAGADYLTVHIETLSDVREALKQIRRLGAKPGLTLKPETPLSAVLPFLPFADLILVMTVNPGFSGQAFMLEQAQKVSELRQRIEQNNLNLLIEVDGGIDKDTAKNVRQADVLVSGNYVFKNDYRSAILALKEAKHD